MFKDVQIRLTGPICWCRTQSLGWDIECSLDGKHGLLVFCKLCQTKVHIPFEQFRAGFELDKKYPDGIDQGASDRIQVDGDGKVIELFPRGKVTE